MSTYSMTGTPAVVSLPAVANPVEAAERDLGLGDERLVLTRTGLAIECRQCGRVLAVEEMTS